MKNKRAISANSIVTNCEIYQFIEIAKYSLKNFLPVYFNPHTPVAQKIADQRCLIANSAENRYLFYIKHILM